VFGRLRRQRPVQFFGEGVEILPSRALHGDALSSQTIQEHAAIRGIEGKKVGAAKQIRALRVLLFQSFGILSEEPHRVFFAIQVQPGRQEELLRLFLLEDGVTVAIPCGRQRFGPVVVKELLKHFLPAEFTHDVFVEL
jgi:hypothetical protein